MDDSSTRTFPGGGVSAARPREQPGGTWSSRLHVRGGGGGGLGVAFPFTPSSNSVFAVSVLVSFWPQPQLWRRVGVAQEEDSYANCGSGPHETSRPGIYLKKIKLPLFKSGDGDCATATGAPELASQFQNALRYHSRPNPPENLLEKAAFPNKVAGNAAIFI